MCLSPYKIVYDPLPIAASTHNLLLVLTDRGSPADTTAFYARFGPQQDAIIIPNTGLALRSFLKRKINRFEIFRCTSLGETERIGQFLVMKNHNADWVHRKATFSQAIHEYNKDGRYHPSVLELLLEFQIYHSQSLKLNFVHWARFASSESKLRDDELKCLVSRFKETDGPSWFVSLNDFLRSFGTGSGFLTWLLSDPPSLDSLSKKEKERLISNKRRLLHFVNGARASEILSSEKFPAGTFLIRPCFSTSSGSNIAATFKLSLGEIHQGIFEDSSKVRKMMLASSELQSAVLAAPPLDISSNLLGFVDKLSFRPARVSSIPKNCGGYARVFSAGSDARSPSMVKRERSFNFSEKEDQKKTENFLKEEEEEEEVEMTYRVKGGDPTLFRQIWMKRGEEEDYEAIKRKIEEVEMEENDGMWQWMEVRKIEKLEEEERGKVMRGHPFCYQRRVSKELEVELAERLWC